MPQRCATCGAENPEINRFCGQCGRRLELANNAVPSIVQDAGSSHSVDDGAPANSDETPALSKYRVVIESASPARTGFLGLSGDDSSYDEAVPEARSHLWRNVAISVVAAALVLTAVEWRSVRDDYLHWHSSAFAPDAAKQEQPPSSSAVAADPAKRVPGAPAAAAKARAPQGVLGNSDHARPAQQTGNSLASAPHSKSSKSSTDAVRPRAMGAPATDIPEQSPAVSKPFAKPRAVHSSASLSGAGGYEMDRAAHAGDARDRAAWLWKAVGKGNPQASVELAKMYAQGSGVVRNCDQAQILLRGPAGRGNEQAKASLQQIRRQGCGAQ